MWISVDERLPDKSKDVLIALSNGEVATGDMSFNGTWEVQGHGYYDIDKKFVTHWMPLPAPPAAGDVPAGEGDAVVRCGCQGECNICGGGGE